MLELVCKCMPNVLWAFSAGSSNAELLGLPGGMDYFKLLSASGFGFLSVLNKDQEKQKFLRGKPATLKDRLYVIVLKDMTLIWLFFVHRCF